MTSQRGLGKGQPNRPAVSARAGLASGSGRLTLHAKSPPAHLVIIPTELIGSVPRSLGLIETFSVSDSADPMLDPLYEEAIRDTMAQRRSRLGQIIAEFV
jgi:hypothetical protein